MRTHRGIKVFSQLALVFVTILPAFSAAKAADFDYYLLALTWSPSWCAESRNARSEQCEPDRDFGFTLHGLWPQDADGGWPEDCRSGKADATRRQTAAMADIMGSSGLAWYEWKKHGRCSGLSAADYFAAARTAYETLEKPAATRSPVTAAELETAFLAANPDLRPESVIVTCRSGRVQEVRICLSKDLRYRPCGVDVLRDACQGNRPLDLPPIP